MCTNSISCALCGLSYNTDLYRVIHVSKNIKIYENVRGSYVQTPHLSICDCLFVCPVSINSLRIQMISSTSVHEYYYVKMVLIILF